MASLAHGRDLPVNIGSQDLRATPLRRSISLPKMTPDHDEPQYTRYRAGRRMPGRSAGDAGGVRDVRDVRLPPPPPRPPLARTPEGVPGRVRRPRGPGSAP